MRLGASTIGPVLVLSALALAACGRPQGEAAADALVEPVEAEAPSPDTKGARWTVTKNQRGLGFGKDAAAPFFSLTCTPSADNDPLLTVIRHARSEPGAKALFAVLGNGIAARFKVDAVLADGEGWRWEATMKAGAGEFDVFTGPRAIEATLPGAGMIAFPPSDLPREFVGWCRRNGKDLPAAEEVSDPPQG